MSTGFGNESISTTLPVTGSGPFTFVIGAIGVGAVGAGALMRAVGRGGSDGVAEAAFGAGTARSLGAAAATLGTRVMDEATVWLDAQLEAPQWLDEQVASAGSFAAPTDAVAWLDQQLGGFTQSSMAS